jgi:hypothetical protein
VSRIDPDPQVQELLATIRARIDELENLLEQVSEHWVYEDGVYRFYHQSFKVYGLQGTTEQIVSALESLAPGRALNAWFREIVTEGTGKRFAAEHNQRWLAETRPIVEAFFHARYFLEMVCKYGRELQEAPAMMPSGWASVLYLFNLR